MLDTTRKNDDVPQLTVEERRPDPLPAPLLALGLCACVGSGGLLALLIVMVS
jgi:hypothetical protein